MKKIAVITCSIFICLLVTKMSWSASLIIEEDTHHLGNNTMPDWDVPVPEGYVWVKDFFLPTLPGGISYIVLRLDTFHVNGWECISFRPYGDKIYINGILVGDMIGYGCGGNDAWRFYNFNVESHIFHDGWNTIRIEVPDDGSDDIMFRDIKLMVNW